MFIYLVIGPVIGEIVDIDKKLRKSMAFIFSKINFQLVMAL